MEKIIRLKIWGSRGSHAAPGKEYLKYGGNTSCIEVIGDKRNERLILDAGTGLGFLGLTMREANSKTNILLSHLHPDHKEDLPHFSPLYAKGNEVNIWLSEKYIENFEKARRTKVDLDFVMNHPSYPISPDEFLSKPTLNILKGPVFLNGLKIQTLEVDHFEGATAFRISSDKRSFVYAPDVSDEFTNSDKAVEFCRDAKLIFWDSLYADKEINEQTKKKHSSIKSVINLAAKTGVKNVSHFHHSPLKNDAALEIMEKQAAELADELGITAFFAKEEMEIEI